MIGSMRHSTSFHEGIEILQNHRGEEVIVPDVLMCLLAEFTPQISVLNELECMLCTRFCVISNIAVTSIDNLSAQAGNRGPNDRLVFPHRFCHGQAKAFTG